MVGVAMQGALTLVVECWITLVVQHIGRDISNFQSTPFLDGLVRLDSYDDIRNNNQTDQSKVAKRQPHGTKV